MATQATLAAAVKRLALWYRREGFLAQAERLLRVALCLQERELGTEHIKVAVTLYQLGELCSDLDKYEEADTFYKRATKVYESQPGSSSELTWHLSSTLRLHEMAEQEICLFEEQLDSAAA